MLKALLLEAFSYAAKRGLGYRDFFLALAAVKKRFIIMFRCPKCRYYIILTGNRVKEYFSDGFDWKKLMKDSYNAYLRA